MRRYAEKTKVPVSNSRIEIERTLQRYGADQFLFGMGDDRALVGFRMNGRHVKIFLTLPKDNLAEVRRRWRAMAMVIKAKLEAVASGISVFDDEFMAHIVLPSGETVGEFMRPQIALAYEKGTMPKLLPGPN